MFDIDGTLVKSYDFDTECFQDESEVRYHSRTYFGDGPCDQKASEMLGYNFVSVGNRVQSPQFISDYTEADKALKYNGL